jgi:hypothetical protein
LYHEELRKTRGILNIVFIVLYGHFRMALLHVNAWKAVCWAARIENDRRAAVQALKDTGGMWAIRMIPVRTSHEMRCPEVRQVTKLNGFMDRHDDAKV